MSGLLDNPITRALIGIAITGIVLSIAIMLLPAWDIPVGILGTIQFIFDKLKEFNFMIPSAVLVRALLITLTLETTFISIKILLFIVDQITDAKGS